MPLSPHLRERLLRRLDTLSDERAYQVLDYVEFLESKYADRQTTVAQTNVFQRFTEGLEDKLRAGQVSANTIAETMGILNKAVGVLGGVAAAGKSVASDIVSAATKGTPGAAGAGTPSTPPAPTAQADGGTAGPSGTPPTPTT